MTTEARGLESRSLVLRGDPDACRASAIDVRALGRVLEEVAEALLAHRDPDRSTGHWASAYTAHARGGVDLAEDLAARCRAVVTALVEADDLLSVARRTLDDVRSVAGEHHLLDGNRLVPPGPDATAEIWRAWRAADEQVTSVRGLERAARHGLERALEVTA